MEPGQIFDVVAQGPAGGILEIVIEADYFVVWGWAGSVVAVYHDGKRLDWPDNEYQPRSPAPPSR